MYRNDWHARHRERTSLAARLILPQLQQDFQPRSVLDIGCGHGDWLRAAMELGIADIEGCDGPWIDAEQLVIPQARFRCEVLDKKLEFGREFDLALCTEVGEHLDRAHARHLVETIASHTDLAFFGAAIPYQGGYRHINEQWQSWWAEQFDSLGFAAFDLVRPLVWDKPIDFWYKQNNLVYVRRSRGDLVERAEAAAARLVRNPVRFNIVHPDQYTRIASYDAIAFRPLLRNFPGAAWDKLKAMVLDR